ncbi:FHA domain-containing protein [Myxococcota bacterium]|nr:FHA domain-containing protein [Myxococcota bacterium]
MKLTVVRGPGEGLVFALQPGRQVAGREMSCAVRVPSTRVSRRHCAFLVQGRRCVVQDLDSSNGVLINGHPMPMCELLDGTYVQIGDVLLRFDGPPPEEPQPPMESRVLEERESFDPDDPDLKPTTVAPAPREILALRSMSMSQLFRGGDEETNLEEGETTAPSVTIEGADELPPEAMRAAEASARAAPPKAEAPKAEAPKAEAPKPTSPKPAAPKAEAPKPAAPKAEAPKPTPPGRKVAALNEAPAPEAKPKRAPKPPSPPAAPPSLNEEVPLQLDLRFWLIVAGVLMTSSVLGLSFGLWLLWSRG